MSDEFYSFSCQCHDFTGASDYQSHHTRQPQWDKNFHKIHIFLFKIKPWYVMVCLISLISCLVRSWFFSLCAEICSVTWSQFCISLTKKKKKNIELLTPESREVCDYLDSRRKIYFSNVAVPSTALHTDPTQLFHNTHLEVTTFSKPWLSP